MPELPPALPLLAGALLMALLPGRRARAWCFLVFPALALALAWWLPADAHRSLVVAGHELVLLQATALSRVFGLIFALIGILGGIYALHLDDRSQQVAALLYGGGALWVAYAGDLLTLLVGWELMAVSSVWLVWARRTPESAAAGNRYLLVHVFGGALLLGGIVIHAGDGGSLLVAKLGQDAGLGAWLMLAGVALNVALPPLHAWLPDAYPRASVTGAVFLSAYTTKSAVYVLARLFPGWELLLTMGVAMALYGVVYAVLANDIRGILAYHIISQVGYMVAGVGIGSELALNGTAAHAFSHILYKALLFMGAGAVLATTGRSELTKLGGFAHRQRAVVWLYMVGAFSISGFPLFNGFISKSIIISAAAESHREFASLMLLLASVGTFLHTGLKLPYFTWWGPDRGIKPEPAPRNMLVAMGATAALCTLFGVVPRLLYSQLPHAMSWRPYTIPHLVETVQILILTFVAFWLLRELLAGEAKLALNTDWIYRRGLVPAGRGLLAINEAVFATAERWSLAAAAGLARFVSNPLAAVRTRRLPEEPYDEDRDRLPLALGLGFMMLLILGLALWSLLEE